MAVVQINNVDVVEQLDRHSKALDVPVTKARLATFIIREVLNAAERQNKFPGELLQELRQKSSAAA